MDDFEGLKKKKKSKKVTEDAPETPTAAVEEDDFSDLKKKKKKKVLDLDGEAAVDGKKDKEEANGGEDDFADLKKKKKKKIDLDEVDGAPAPASEAAPVAGGVEGDGGEDDFSDLKKKKKKKPALDLDDASPAAATPLSEPAPEASGAGDDDEFADLKKKKTKKKVLLDVPLEAGLSEPGSVEAAAASGEAEDDFSDLKKKSTKKKKKDFDLDAFEKELQASGVSGTGTLGGEDGGKEEGKDEKEDDDEEMSEYLKAARDQKWLKEDRDYQYNELLGRFYTSLYLSHPNLSPYSTTGAKKYTLAPPQVQKEGNKRSIFTNVGEICRKMHRSPEHVIQFLFAELGTTGSVDGNGSLVIKGRFQGKQIENVLRRYILEYVTCKICKSPDTLLEKDNRLFFVSCQTCNSRRSVTAIKTGYQAQIGKRIKTDK